MEFAVPCRDRGFEFLCIKCREWLNRLLVDAVYGF